MRIAGIIAEYNPFHAGHAHQIAQLRAQGFDAVVCVCSPSVVQRGTAALFPAAVRVHAALVGGADLVLSLPAPYATLSAEGFARAGVALLAGLGVCEALAFGAETPEVQVLEAVAQVLDSAAFSPLVQAALAGGTPFAAARAQAAEQLYPGAQALLAAPNNILAVEYCRALAALRRADAAVQLPQALALARKGAQHDAPLPACGGAMASRSEQPRHGDNGAGAQHFASATALRALVLRRGVDALADYVPPACQAVYRTAARAGQRFNPAAWDIAVLSRLRALDTAALAQVRGVREGLENRLGAAVRGATGLEELYSAVKTKRYAHARVRRLVLDAALGYTAQLPEKPPYLHVLGASRTGLTVLAHAKRAARLPLSHSLRALEQTSPQARAVAVAHAAAEDLAALCLCTPLPQGTAYTGKLIVTEDAHG